MKYISLMFLVLVFCVSCGGADSKTSKRVTRIEEQEVAEIMDHQNFKCASLKGSCPSGVTRLLILNKTDPDLSHVCSGFMVGPNKLITNHHCVSTRAECDNTFIAIYSGDTYEKTRCKRIIKTQQDVDDPNDPSRKLDYTVMETEDIYTGETFTLSKTLASPGDSLNVWVIDHTGLDELESNLLNSRVTQFKCEVIDQTERASLMAMSCPIISGNSGSPALNTNGEVVGVVWGGTAVIDSSYNLSLRRQLEEFALMTEVNYFQDYFANFSNR